MLTSVVPVADNALPGPWAPAFPSLNVQSICTLGGGASLELRYPIDLSAVVTSDGVALALNVSTSVPPALVVTVANATPPCERLPPGVITIDVDEKRSSALAPPCLASVSVAPP